MEKLQNYSMNIATRNPTDLSVGGIATKIY